MYRDTLDAPRHRFHKYNRSHGQKERDLHNMLDRAKAGKAGESGRARAPCTHNGLRASSVRVWALRKGEAPVANADARHSCDRDTLRDARRQGFLKNLSQSTGMMMGVCVSGALAIPTHCHVLCHKWGLTIGPRTPDVTTKRKWRGSAIFSVGRLNVTDAMGPSRFLCRT